MLWQFLVGHERCITRHCAVPRFDTVTMVPSTSGRVDHPLRTMVAQTVGVTRERCRDLLTATPTAAGLAREASLRRYTSAALWGGEAVLLIDDTWTTGGHAQSASAALKRAGASCVAVVVLGRHLNGSWGNTASYVEQARLRRFSWNVCALRNWHHD